MNVVSHNCPTCSGPLMFDVDTQNWTCDYCKRAYDIEELMNYITKKKEIKTVHLHGYACDNCGASIVSCDDNVSTTCAYCGSAVIMKDRIEREYKPDLIAPFKHKKEEIVDLFIKNSGNRPLTSKAFFNRENIKSVVGVYIPFFVVSAEVSATVYGDARVNKEMRSSFIRKGTMKLENVPADAKTILNNDFLRGLEPFEYEEFKKFEYPYLAGFYAEKFDDTKEDVYKEQIHKRIEEAALDKVVKSGRRYLSYEILSQEIKTFCTEFKYALIPIWCIHMNYRGKDYIYYVNDQNLIIAGTYPINPFKEIISCLGMVLLTILFFNCDVVIPGKYALLVTIFGIAISWIIYLNAILSYSKVKQQMQSKDYIKAGSFLLISSTDNEYSLKG